MTDQDGQLSDRESEILRLLATGASNKEIANELVISVNTVKVHLRNIYGKLDVSSRTEASMWAVRSGLVTTDDELADSSKQNLSEEIESSGRSPRFLWNIIVLGGIFVILLALMGVWTVWQRSSINDALLEQSVETKRWLELANLSTPRSRFAFTTYENQLYTIGGKTETGVTNVVEIYNPQTDNWSILSPKSIPVANVSAVVIGGKVIVPGGELESGEVTNIVETYDPYEDQWDMVAPMPKALSAYAIAAYEGKLYLFGGWDGNQYVDTVYTYDPVQDLWSMNTSLPTPRGYSGTVVIGNRIHILGGISDQKALDTNDIFLPGNNDTQWITGTPLPNGRYSAGVAGFADVIYVIGGATETGEGLMSLQFDVSENIWQPLGSLQTQTWTNMGALLIGSNLYIWGGELGDIQTNKLWSYQAIYTIVLPIIQQ